VIERQLAVERANLAGAGRQLDRLVLRAPVDGVVTDLAPDMHPGRWLSGAEVVARVVRPGHLDVQAYLPEDDFWRIEPDATGRFVPDDLAQPSRKAKLAEQAQAAVQYLDQPLLASVNGGPIAVNKDGQGRLKPREAIYRLRFLAAVDESWEGKEIVQPQTGRIVVKAEGRSVIGGLLRQIAQILRREASLT
jgi:putative peptide zinc metalloprotease protein